MPGPPKQRAARRAETLGQNSILGAWRRMYKPAKPAKKGVRAYQSRTRKRGAP